MSGFDTALGAARLRLMLDEPYLATAIASLPFVSVDVPWCPTMATDGYRIFVNESWCLSLSARDLEFVIAHEVLHCVLGHPDRKRHRNAVVWNMAADFAVNGLLRQCGFEVPDGALWSWSYLNLTAEEIYEQLLETLPAAKKRGGTRRGRKDPNSLEDFDVLLDPGSALLESTPGLPSIPSPDERRRLRKRFALDLKRANRLHGTTAGSTEAEIAAAGEPCVPWQALLAHFVTGLRRSDYRLFPFNRKHIWHNLYLPSLGVPGPRHIVAAVDTSGSMGDRTLGQILSELDALRAQTECLLTLIECDAEIQRVERLEAFETSVVSKGGQREFLGRGGTDFNPVFSWLGDEIRENPETPDALFYLTDGFGTIPRSAPEIPVLWLVPAHGSRSFPFGDVLRMET